MKRGAITVLSKGSVSPTMLRISDTDKILQLKLALLTPSSMSVDFYFQLSVSLSECSKLNLSSTKPVTGYTHCPNSEFHP